MKKLPKEDLIEKCFDKDLISSIYYLEKRYEKDIFCRTCYKQVKQGKIPKIALKNGLDFPEIPECLRNITRLEERNIAARIPFMCIKSLGIDKQCGLKGSIINVPNPVDRTISMLPRNFSDTFVIHLKLKRRMAYKSHYMFETVCPEKIFKAANYLVKQDLYKKEGITLSSDWLETAKSDIQMTQATTSKEKCSYNERPKNIDYALNDNEGFSDFEDGDLFEDDEFENFRYEDTLLQNDEVPTIIFAPGEGQKPLSLLLDENAEELAFPTIYAGKARKCAANLSYGDISNSEIRRFDRRAARTDHLLYAYKKNEISKISSAVSIALKKKRSFPNLKVKNMLNNVEINNLIQADQGYRFLRNIRSSPAHWESEKKKVCAMIRQFGLPSIFITLSAAESKWPELLRILKSNVDNINISAQEANNMTFDEKARLIRSDAVTCALYFWNTFKQLFKTWKSINGPFGEHGIEHHYFRVEFQHRGSPHVHMLLWLKNAPVFSSTDDKNLKEVTSFIDNLITCSSKVPEGNEDLIKLQKHKHTYSCKEKTGKKKSCRFGIPFFPMDATRILLPVDDEKLLEKMKSKIEQITKKIKEIQPNENESITFDNFLNELNLTKNEYLLCIQLTLKKPKVFLKRDLNEIYINNYNYKILSLHRANMDIQFILDAYACASYVVDYINKSDRGLSKLLRETLMEARKGNSTLRKQLKSVANKFINCSEISAQEAAWNLLRLPMSEASEAEVFIPTCPPDERIKIIKTEKELRKMDPESTDIFVSGLIDHYIERPDVLENVCLAKFAAGYNFHKFQKRAHRSSNSDDEEIHLTNDTINNDKMTSILELKDHSGYLTARSKLKVIRYRKYDKKNDPNNFFRELLMLYAPWRSEEKDLTNINFKAVFDEKKEIVMENRRYFVANAENDSEIDDAIELREKTLLKESTIGDSDDNVVDDEYFIYDCGSTAHQFDIRTELGEVAPSGYADAVVIPQEITENDYSEMISKLNLRQRDYLMHVMHEVKVTEKVLRHFVSGSAGTGKTVLIKALYHSLLKYYNKRRGCDPSDIKVLLCAPTGKAAFNIEGMTLHSAFSLPITQCGKECTELSAEISNTLCVKFRSLKAIIIDEVSMMGSQMLNNVNRRLKNIFRNDEDFGGISIFVFGDFRQLPPVGDSFIFLPSRSDIIGQLIGPPSALWENFKLFELTEIMRQKSDMDFAKALCNLADGTMTKSDIDLFSSRVFEEHKLPEESKQYIRLFSTNAEKDRYNDAVLKNMKTEGMLSESLDRILGNGSEDVKKRMLEVVEKKKITETYGLPRSVLLKISARYMVTNNIDLEDGLVNGSTGILKKIQQGILEKTNKSIPIRLWIEFDSKRVGAKARNTFAFYRQKNNIPDSWTPIELITRQIHTRKSSNLQIIRTQFPVIAAEGITIHKSQGSTYPEVVVHLNKRMTRQALYVACSRTTKASGLYLIGKFIPPSSPSQSDVIEIEMRRLREKPIIPKF